MNVRLPAMSPMKDRTGSDPENAAQISSNFYYLVWSPKNEENYDNPCDKLVGLCLCLNAPCVAVLYKQ